MTNHTNKHGILTNGTVEFPVHVKIHQADGFFATIDGSKRDNFFVHEEWSFKPAREPLPQSAGSVIKIKNLMPIIRVGAKGWIMPQCSYPSSDGKVGLATPLMGRKFLFSDDDVHELVDRNPDAIIIEG